jgi:hypothetical protein
MEMSDQLHALVALTSEKRSLYPLDGKLRNMEFSKVSKFLLGPLAFFDSEFDF